MDYSARRLSQKYLQVVDPDYYEWETHILFDDAFELGDNDEDEQIVNQFVKMLVRYMDEAGSFVHCRNIKVKAPKRYPTPYGGRLVWTLPGKTKIVCHLKDKAKIRHKKRWSQCMYMYYLLGKDEEKMLNIYMVARYSIGSTYMRQTLAQDGAQTHRRPNTIACLITSSTRYRNVCIRRDTLFVAFLGFKLMELPISDVRKEVIAENTYLLALDGDIDFQPEAITRLVDLMKKNKNLGAACGRIHPTGTYVHWTQKEDLSKMPTTFLSCLCVLGSGFMMWYQRFEYAIGHWLQKSTEHVLGCVLCSPGCFSLFR